MNSLSYIIMSFIISECIFVSESVNQSPIQNNTKYAFYIFPDEKIDYLIYCYNKCCNTFKRHCSCSFKDNDNQINTYRKVIPRAHRKLTCK